MSNQKHKILDRHWLGGHNSLKEVVENIEQGVIYFIPNGETTESSLRSTAQRLKARITIKIEKDGFYFYSQGSVSPDMWQKYKVVIPS